MAAKDTLSPLPGPASYGVLENAMDNAETLMEILQDTVDKIDVTGQLKHKYLNGHTEIEILAIPKTTTGITGEPQHSLEMHALLLNTIEDLAWIEDEPPNYKWQGEYYTWKLTTLKDESQWTVAQIIHTGPDYFTKWLTSSRTHRKGALPWGYSIFEYAIVNNNGISLATQTESEFWRTLGYLPIPLEDRANGNPKYWRTFELVQKLV